MKAFIALATLVVVLSLGTGPASADTVVYDNTNSFANKFNVDAWAVGGLTGIAFAVANSFSGVGTVQGVNFWVWELPGDPSLSSVQWSIVTDSGGLPTGTTVAGGTISSLTSTSDGTNSFDYNIFEETFSTGTVSLTPGQMYWLELQGATVPSGDVVFWDESDGPSVAWDSPLGLLTNTDNGCGIGGPSCSESFQLTTTGTTVPEPGTLALLGAGLLFLAARRRPRASC